MKTIELNDGRYALVDDEDFGELSRHKWYVIENHGHAYASRQVWIDGKPHTVKMHRVVMAAVRGQIVDHINHDTLDNRRDNLRICTASQNSQNARQRRTSNSPFKGIRETRGRWQARISINGTRLHLGYFNTAIEAAAAYDRAARELFTEFACVNFAEAA